jgi:transposase InsO family protein
MPVWQPTTRFSTAKVIYSKGKEWLIESVFTHWISLFGRPRRFLSDNGGEYNNSYFLDMCDKLGVHVITTGAESPWSNGLVERLNGIML